MRLRVPLMSCWHRRGVWLFLHPCRRFK
jgi:hypothetical protein